MRATADWLLELRGAGTDAIALFLGARTVRHR